MKTLLSLFLTWLSFSVLCSGQARLTYHFNGTDYVVDGFDFSRPYSRVDGDKQYLPIEGAWGLVIEDESFWDECYFPKTYKIGKNITFFADKGKAGIYGIGFEEDSFPVGENEHAELASFWLPEDFQGSLVVLGWYFDGRVTSTGVVGADRPVNGWLLNEVFKKLRIRAEHTSGFPFFCLFSQDTLKLRPTHNNRDKSNYDYLYRLACRGTAEDFRQLGLSRGDLRKAYVDEKLSLMHGAALYGNLDVLKYFQEVGAHKIKLRGESTVMRYAVLGAREKAVAFLKDLGHDPTEKTKLTYTAFEECVQLGQLAVFDYLTDERKNLKFVGYEGNAAYLAVARGDQEIWNLIASKTGERFPEIKSQRAELDPNHLQKIFHDNCLLGNLSIVEALMELGVDLEKKTRGYTPLAAAVLSGNPDLVKFLIENGSDIQVKSGSNSSSLLHLAVGKGFASLIPVLAEAGLGVDTLDKRGRTALYSAVLAKQVSSVHELLALGADPNLRPDKRPAAVWMAVVQDERESIQSLIDYGATCELNATLAMQLMDYALAFDIPEVVSISLEQCLAPDFSFRGSVPGMWVADYYHAELCKEVLREAGADPAAAPNWKFNQSAETIGPLMETGSFPIQYPKRLREKYGNLKVKVEVIVDPAGNVRFPRFLEPLPWDLRLFLRESIRRWSVDLPQGDDLNTAYRLIIPLVLKTDDFGVKVYEIAELDKPPSPKVRVAPVYPRELKANRITGSVTVVFIVDEAGKVTRESIEKSDHRDFNEAALVAVRQWEFIPGYLNGEPVKTRVRLPLSFTLRE